jgi:hypothetical protein
MLLAVVVGRYLRKIHADPVVPRQSGTARHARRHEKSSLTPAIVGQAILVLVTGLPAKQAAHRSELAPATSILSPRQALDTEPMLPLSAELASPQAPVPANAEYQFRQCQCAIARKWGRAHCDKTRASDIDNPARRA